VISHALWLDRFGGDAGIVNKTISLNGKPYSILGVMPAGFEFPNKVDLWAPVGPLFAESSWQERDNHPGLFGLARLKPGVTLEKARGDLDVIAVRLEQQYPESNKTRRVQIDRLLDQKVGNVRRALWILLGAVSFVLVIACANVANLLLARAAARETRRFAGHIKRSGAWSDIQPRGITARACHCGSRADFRSPGRRRPAPPQLSSIIASQSRLCH